MNVKEIARAIADEDFMEAEDWERVAKEMEDAALCARECVVAKGRGKGEYKKAVEAFVTRLDDASKGMEMIGDEIK